MALLADILVALIALQHLGILVLEMFLWDKPAGMRIFRLSPEQARETRTLAANQGLYNGFLAAGLVWALSLDAAGTGARLFFLTCVLVAGVYGWLSSGRPKIFFFQSLPALITLLVLAAT